MSKARRARLPATHECGCVVGKPHECRELRAIARIRLSESQRLLLVGVERAGELEIEDREIRSLDVLTDYRLVTQGHGKGRRGARVTTRGQQWLRRNGGG